MNMKLKTIYMKVILSLCAVITFSGVAIAGIGTNNAWLDDDALLSSSNDPVMTFIGFIIFIAFLINAPAMTLGLISFGSLLLCIFSSQSILFGIIALSTGVTALYIDRKKEKIEPILIKCDSCGVGNTGEELKCTNCGFPLVKKWKITPDNSFKEQEENLVSRIHTLNSKLKELPGGEQKDKLNSLKWIIIGTLALWVGYTFKIGLLKGVEKYLSRSFFQFP